MVTPYGLNIVDNCMICPVREHHLFCSVFPSALRRLNDITSHLFLVSSCFHQPMGFCAVHSESDYTSRAQIRLRDKSKPLRGWELFFHPSKTGEEWGSHSWSEDKKSKPKAEPVPLFNVNYGVGMIVRTSLDLMLSVPDELTAVVT